MSSVFRVLFWNLHGRADALSLALALFRDRNVDLFIAAELPGDARPLTLSRGARLGYQFRSGLRVEEIASYNFAAAFRVRLSASSRDITVVGVHLPSRLYLRDPEDQRMAADTCHGFIEEREQPITRGGVGHDRTVVIGDFNLDPYSPAMVGLGGLNAMMTPRRTRRANGRERACFYNPMWNEFGDRRGSAGTYYLETPGALGYYWHMLDQVLVRQPLVAHLELVSVIHDELVSPRARTPRISDHLPIELVLSTDAFDSRRTT